MNDKERIAELEAELTMRREQAEGLQNQWAKDTQKIVALEAEVKMLREALIDMRSGWKYIRETHGDLYGVGWDRAQNKADAALAAGEGMGQSVVLLRQYATLLKMTTEGTDALVAGLSEEANIVHCYEEMTNLCRAYEQRMKIAEAEVTRLNTWADGMADAAMKERHTGELYQRELRDNLATLEQRLKVVEAETVDRCAKVCDLLAENHKHIAGESQQGRIDAEPFIHTAQTLAKAIRALEEKT